MDGPPYQAALRLYVIAEQRWAEIEIAYITSDLLRFPPAKFLNAVYVWCLERIEPEKLEQWLFQLSAPLPGEEDKVSETTQEVEGDAFMNAMSLVNGA